MIKVKKSSVVELPAHGSSCRALPGILQVSSPPAAHHTQPLGSLRKIHSKHEGFHPPPLGTINHWPSSPLRRLEGGIESPRALNPNPDSI